MMNHAKQAGVLLGTLLFFVCLSPIVWAADEAELQELAGIGTGYAVAVERQVIANA